MRTTDGAVMKRKVAFIGCGQIANVHMRFLSRLGIEVGCVCDSSITRARLFAGKYGIPGCYGDLDEMLELERPEVAHVLTPPHTHFSLASRALEGGCHVFVEKPLCLRSDQADSLFDSARERGKKIGVDLTRVYNPMLLRAREYMARGRIGEIVRMEYDYDDPSIDPVTGSLVKGAPIWFNSLPGGVACDLLPHPVSVLLSLDPHLEVTGVHARVNANRYVEELVANLSSERCEAVVDLSIRIRPLRNTLKIYCTRGWIRIDLRNLYMVCLPDRGLPNIIGRVVNTLSEVKQIGTNFAGGVSGLLAGRVHPYSGLEEILRLFYDTLEGDSPPSMIDSKRVVRLCEEILERSLNGGCRDPGPDRPMPVRRTGGAGRRVDCLVTGGTGFIGKALVKRLLAGGRSVRVLCRNARQADQLPRDVEPFTGDIRDRPSLFGAVEGVHTVFHCAAAMRGDWADFYETTVLGTANLLDAIRRCDDVSGLVYLSSLGILDYNRLKNGRPVNENSPLEAHSHRRGYYTKSKKEAEDAVRVFARENNRVKTVIVRPGLVYGPESNNALANSGILLGRHLFVFGVGKRYLGLSYVENLADALAWVSEIDFSSGAVYHLLDEDQPTVSAYIRIHNELSKDRIIPVYVPIFVWRAAFGLVDFMMKLKNGTGGTFSYRFSSNSKRLLYESDLIRRETGWRPRYDFQRAIRQCFKR